MKTTACFNLVAEMVKNLPAKQETQVEVGNGNSSILAWKIPWTEEAGGLKSMGSQRVGHHRSNSAHTSGYTFSCLL